MNDKARREEIMEAAADWCDRLDTLTVDERKALNRWLAADPEHARAYARMRHTMQDVALLDAAENTAPAAASVRKDFAVPAWLSGLLSSRAGYGVLVGAAAFAALVIVLRPGQSPVPQAPMEQASGQVLATITGEQRNAMLADKSVVYLNADTRLAVTYSGRARRLALSRGEAIFQVTKDKARPFSVAAGAATVTAVGTRFGVDRIGDAVEVRVFEGTVKVDGETVGTRAVTKGQWLIVDPGRGVTAGNFAPDQYDTWRTGWLTADRMPLAYVVARLNRYTDEKIEIADRGLTDIDLSGRFRLDNPGGTLKQIAALADVDIVKHDHRILLTRKPEADTNR